MRADGHRRHRPHRGRRVHAGLQRRVRALAPAPLVAADLAAFRAVARLHVPVVGAVLRPLSRAANHSRLWLAVAAALHLLGGRFERRAALRGMLAVGLTSALTNLPAKLLTGRMRPDLTPVPELRRLARVPSSTSFPSGHAASAAAFATAVGMERPALRAPLGVLAGLVGVSRVWTGVHYPGDVLVGAAIGTGVARATARTWPLADPTPASAPVVTLPDDALPGPDGQGLVVVANAGAGNALGADVADQLGRLLPAATIQEVDPDEDLDAALRRAARSARVLGVAGGDGSASAAAAVASDHGLPLAVVPAGTLNHLGTDLGVERAEETVRGLQDGRVVAMDLGVLDGRPFVNAGSVGVYPHLVADRERLEGRIGKWPAALWCLLRLLVRGTPFELEIDGRPRRVWLLFLGNGRFRAEGLAPTRRARLDTACLDVRLVAAEPRLARTRLLASLVTGRLGRSRVLERRTAERVEVVSRQGPLRLARDGETWLGPDRVVAEVRPGALLVVQPDPVDRAG